MMNTGMNTDEAMELWYGDTLIWKNPPEIGFFGVKLRKQIREEEIIAMIPRRMGWARNPPDDIQ